jgi:hypothetical protein
LRRWIFAGMMEAAKGVRLIEEFSPCVATFQLEIGMAGGPRYCDRGRVVEAAQVVTGVCIQWCTVSAGACSGSLPCLLMPIRHSLDTCKCVVTP